MAPRKVFVLGATGVQGGALARQLRALGWDVATLARNPSSAAAQALASIGVQVHEGSWTDSAAVEKAVAGSDSLFLNLLPDITNPVAEFEQGSSILGIAKAAGVQHVVYSSGMFVPIADPNHFVNVAFKSKFALEELVQTSDFPRWTILRPGFFPSNYLAPKIHMLYPGAAETGVLTLAIPPTSRVPAVDNEDIAKFAVAALQRPDKFHGQLLDVVSEVVTVGQAIETIRRVMGRNVRARYLTAEETKEALPTNPLLVLQEVTAQLGEPLAGFDAAAEARKWGVETNTFEQFVQREKKDFDETFAKVEVVDN